MTESDLRMILRRIEFKDWNLYVYPCGDGWLIHWEFSVRDEERRTQTRFKSRKWYVSPHSCESEVIQTVLLATLTAVEHEAREEFKVDGEAAYGPHISVYAHLAKAHDREARKDHR